MFDFGDELIIETYRIPCLIWIQLVIMLLLVILLFCFSTTPSTLATTSNASPLLITASLGNFKVRENQIKENGTSTSTVIQRARNEDIQQREGSSTKDGEHGMIFEHSHHPCHFFGVAKQAFLKCLGLDSAPESSSEREHRKDH